MSVLRNYNWIRCAAEDGTNSATLMAEQLCLSPCIARFMAHFPEWEKDLSGLARDCRGIRKDSQVNPYWCAIAFACHAQTAAARGKTAFQLRLLGIADEAIHQIVPADPVETRWIVAPIDTCRMDAVPHLFRLGTYLHWTTVMIILGVFDAPSRVQRVVKELLKLQRPDDARDLIRVLEKRRGETECYFSKKQYDDLKEAHPDLFES